MDIVIPDAGHLDLFVSAALVLLLIPGPAVLYIVGCSVTQGRRAGLVSTLGIHAATLVHVTAATVGLSALLASSALAFGAVKYAGAAYLVWLGITRLRCTEEASSRTEQPPRTARRLFRDGFVVNLLNPKTALFFLAFLPQFAEPVRGALAMQIAFLGLLFVAIGLVTDGGYALAAGAAGTLLRRRATGAGLARYASGLLFIGLGVSAALAGGQRR